MSKDNDSLKQRLNALKDDVASLRALYTRAQQARDLAYAPYSKFYVGAAILLEDGTIVAGCNVENASLGLSLCAERVAMVKSISEGKKRPLAVAVAGIEGVLCSPCGACRQFLSEFNGEMLVILADGDALVVHSLADILPLQFKL